jgi:pyridinium-3,5-biscarboxylic acid mononucleotide synthase
MRSSSRLTSRIMFGAVREILQRLKAGELSLEEAESELRHAQLVELDGRARLDVGRPARRGLPEVVLAEGKAPDETARLVVALARRQGQGLVSRLGAEHRSALEASHEELELRWYGSHAARALRAGWAPERIEARLAVLTAGTSDLDAAHEVAMLAEAAGIECRLEADVGVAGLHRLLGPLAELEAWGADCYVVAAGMDGVLPGVVAGLVGVPVIGLPVPTGYGAGGRGEAALGTMLQSCSTGLTVVNIGNGVGAGAAAVLIAARVAAARRPAQQPAPPA